MKRKGFTFSPGWPLRTQENTCFQSRLIFLALLFIDEDMINYLTEGIFVVTISRSKGIFYIVAVRPIRSSDLSIERDCSAISYR
jgi:hypothetical protein